MRYDIYIYIYICVCVIRRLRVKAPDLLDFRHYKGGSLSATRTGRLYPRRNPWYSFSEVESTSGNMDLSEGATERIPNDTTGDLSRYPVRLVAQRLKHYANPDPNFLCVLP